MKDENYEEWEESEWKIYRIQQHIAIHMFDDTFVDELYRFIFGDEEE